MHERRAGPPPSKLAPQPAGRRYSSEQPGRVAGKVALVTGGMGGIGQAIALRLGQEGARIVLTDIHADTGNISLKALQAQGIDAAFVQHDVRNEDSWRNAIAFVIERFGRLDVLVNNAGIGRPPPESFELTRLEDWRDVMDVNLDGVFIGTREGVAAMKDTGGGSIINIGSIAAFVGTPGGAVYGSSKGAVQAMSRQAAVACARKGFNIRINVVHPSFIRTPMTESGAFAGDGKEKAIQKMKALHPFQALGDPDDVAYTVLFLASDESRLINGADIMVDGALLCAPVRM